MGSRGGGFRTNPDLNRRFTLSNLRDFGRTIQSDETISDITKKELSEEITAAQGEGTLGGAQAASQRIRGIFAQAQQGQGKFAGRQIQSRQRALLSDRPGRAQTILTR